MSDYIGWVITNKGRELLAKVINHETKLNITKLEIGSGYNTENDRELTALINSKNYFLVNSYERKDNATVEFTFIVSNRATTGEALNSEAYQIKEMGIFASDDAGDEVLYAYNKGTNGDYLPVFNGKNQIDIIEKCIITIDQQADMNVNIDNSVTYVTYDGLRRELDKKVSKTDLATETEMGLVTLRQIRELVPTIPEASESQAGLVTLAKIKETVRGNAPSLDSYATTVNVVNSHTRKNIDTEEGVHGLRYFDKKLQVRKRVGNEINGEVWEKVETGDPFETSLEKLIGMPYGGTIQGTSRKEAGKFYYDTTTREYYECIESNNLNYAESSKYRSMSQKNIGKGEIVAWNTEKNTNLSRNDRPSSTSGTYEVGSFKIGNFIIKFGRTSSELSSVYFPTPFPTRCISVVLTPVRDRGIYENIDVYSFDNRKFTYIGELHKINGISWIAIGY